MMDCIGKTSYRPHRGGELVGFGMPIGDQVDVRCLRLEWVMSKSGSGVKGRDWLWDRGVIPVRPIATRAVSYHISES